MLIGMPKVAGGVNLLEFLDEFGFKLHGPDAINFAVDVVIAVDQTDVLNLGANLYDQ
jgi:hypothetical protein